MPPTFKSACYLSSYNYCPVINEDHPARQEDACGYFFLNGTIFKGNKKLKHVLIRNGVKTIGNNCFNDSNLVSLTVPASVTEICRFSFANCHKLRKIVFQKDSKLKEIGEMAFQNCILVKINFPKSLKILRSGAFNFCSFLEKVIFPADSQLEVIEEVFMFTAIKNLSIPPSIKEIFNVSHEMKELEKIYVKNDLFESNEDGSVIFSKDGSEMICAIKNLKSLEIPDGVRVIRQRAFLNSMVNGKLVIPTSVEIIENEAFRHCKLKVIEFSEGSRLKSIGIHAFPVLEKLKINNGNFITRKDGMVSSCCPKALIFIPKYMIEGEKQRQINSY